MSRIDEIRAEVFASFRPPARLSLPDKGIDFLLSALSRVEQPFRAVIAGSGPWDSLIVRKTNRMPPRMVVFINPVMIPFLLVAPAGLPNQTAICRKRSSARPFFLNQ